MSLGRSTVNLPKYFTGRITDYDTINVIVNDKVFDFSPNALF